MCRTPSVSEGERDESREAGGSCKVLVGKASAAAAGSAGVDGDEEEDDDGQSIGSTGCSGPDKRHRPGSASFITACGRAEWE